MSAEQKNELIICGDLQHVSIIAEVEVFGHNFKRKEPMDYIIPSKFDPEIAAYLEIGEEKCALHEKEPTFHALHGYQSDGYVIQLELQGDGGLPNGVYPLKVYKKKHQQKSGE